MRRARPLLGNTRQQRGPHLSKAASATRQQLHAVAGRERPPHAAGPLNPLALDHPNREVSLPLRGTSILTA